MHTKVVDRAPLSLIRTLFRIFTLKACSGVPVLALDAPSQHSMHEHESGHSARSGEHKLDRNGGMHGTARHCMALHDMRRAGRIPKVSVALEVGKVRAEWGVGRGAWGELAVASREAGGTALSLRLDLHLRLKTQITSTIVQSLTTFSSCCKLTKFKSNMNEIFSHDDGVQVHSGK